MSAKDTLMRLAVPSLVSKIKDRLLQVKTKVGWPPAPIIELDDRFLKVELDRSVIRNWGLSAGFLTMIFLSYGFVEDIHSTWKSSEVFKKDYFESIKNKYGEDFYKIRMDKIDTYLYDQIGDDLVLSFDEYIFNVRYSKGFYKPMRKLGFDIFKISFLVIGMFTFLYFFIRFKRLAPLIFDRERRIFYTWRFGKAVAQKYDDMQYRNHIQGLFIPMGIVPTRKRWGEKTIPDNAIGWLPFRIMPHGNLYVNDMAEYEGILAYIVQFMEFGREHVMPDKTEWKRKTRDFLFYEDERPADLESQIEDVLKRLESNRPAWLNDVKNHEEKGWSK
ncbi:MAG: hypothetical protein ACI843_001157 [Psychrobacter glaciei]|jgi:hypothetical protein